MGMSVNAVAGIGFVIDLRKIENEDHRDELGEVWSAETDGVFAHKVGSYDHSDDGLFIGVGARVCWNTDISEEPAQRIESLNDIRDTIYNFLEGVVFDDGSNALQYAPSEHAGFGLHVYPHVN